MEQIQTKHQIKDFEQNKKYFDIILGKKDFINSSMADNPDEHYILVTKNDYKSFIDFSKNASLDEKKEFQQILQEFTVFYTQSDMNTNINFVHDGKYLINEELKFNCHLRVWNVPSKYSINKQIPNNEKTVYETIIENENHQSIVNEEGFNTKYSIVICPRNPKGKTHYLIVTKKRYIDANDFYKNAPIEEQEDFFNLLDFVVKEHTEKNPNQWFIMRNNNGSLADQTVPHFHWHILFNMFTI